MDDIWNIIFDLRSQLIVNDHLKGYKHVMYEFRENVQKYKFEFRSPWLIIRPVSVLISRDGSLCEMLQWIWVNNISSFVPNFYYST